jgi:oligopeptidase B
MAAARTTRPKPPVARKRPKVIEQLGRTRTDNYAWMKDPRWQEVLRDPKLLRREIRSHLVKENAFTQAVLIDPTAELRETLFKEMRGRIKEDDSTVPAPDGAFAYFTAFRTGGQYPILTRHPIDPKTKARTGADQVLLDGDAEGKDKAYWGLGGAAQSPDHKLYAYSTDENGSEYYTIRFKNLETGALLPDTVTNSTGDFVWANDSKTYFWIFKDENGRPTKVFRRVLGSSEDVLVYEETDPGWFMGLGKTASERFIVLGSNASQTTEVRILDANAPTGDFQLIAKRQQGIEYGLEDHDGQFYILTNVDGAVDFKVMTAPVSAPQRENWRDLIPHQPGRLIEGLEMYKHHLVLSQMVNALPTITVRNIATGESHDVTFPEEAYDLDVQRGFEWDTETLRFVYQSPSTPRETWDYDMSARTRVLMKRQEVPSGHNPSDYVVRRINAPSTDGALVPVTILYRKGTPIDGTAPTLLYGYGSYGYSMPASFSTGRLSLVDRGFVYAIAHIRGGKERGYQWYLDGKLMKKKNTFIDFIAAGDELVRQKFSHPKKIVAQGGSAGGMLMGAVVNMRPDLFAGIIADVPFVDVLNTMSDKDLPLTPPEWPAWGNPLEDPAAYDYIASYSPYDQVGDKPYPPILALGGLTDPRVTYWEPAKWVAQLRERAPNAGPYLLKINMEAGHGGASGRFDFLKEVAIEWAFAIEAAAGRIKG